MIRIFKKWFYRYLGGCNCRAAAAATTTTTTAAAAAAATTTAAVKVVSSDDGHVTLHHDCSNSLHSYIHITTKATQQFTTIKY